VDGGVKVNNIGEIAAAGADMFVAGSILLAVNPSAFQSQYCADISATITPDVSITQLTDSLF
ncbi:hypothetical protein MZF04_20405, partial [Escherichia coli]|nr:hypothetical protein [Escherichia coli]